MTREGKAKKQQTEDWLKKHGITWLTGYGSKVNEAYGVRGIPTTFVIGADDKVAWNDDLGGDLGDAIEKALAAKKK